MSLPNQPDTLSIIRQLPRSVAPFKWMFGLDTFLGLRPFNSVLFVPQGDEAALEKHQIPSPRRPRVQSVVSSWGMFFYVLHCILYATSICMWQFTDVYSLMTNPFVFMKSAIALAQMLLMVVLCLVFITTMLVMLLLCHDDHNRMADLITAAEVHFFRLGVSLRQLDCHSQSHVQLVDGFQLVCTLGLTYSVSSYSTSMTDSPLVIWYRIVLVISPLVFRVVITMCFTQELMLLARRIGLLNMVLEELLARERTSGEYVVGNDSIKLSVRKWLH